VSRAHKAISGGNPSGVENPGSKGTPDMMQAA
jgi:hypothetical protein